MRLLNELNLDLADVALICDRPSIVNSRENVLMDMSRILHAPMSANQHYDFVLGVVESGMSIVIHRFNLPEDQRSLVNYALNNRKQNSRVWVSVGLKDWEERLELNKDKILNDKLGVCVDVANSFSVQVQEVLKRICDKFPFIKNTNRLMVGNINSKEGFSFSQKYAGAIRVNIGSGIACSTTKSTGFSQGTFTLLKDLYELPDRSADIIFDGGLKNPGDFAKAFLGGADWCMTGGFFAQAEETHSDVYYGGASEKAKELTGQKADYVEGKVLEVKEKVSLESLTKKIKDGVVSAISYAGYSSLSQAIGRGTFIRVLK